MSEINAIVETADLHNFLGAEVGMAASGERLTVALALSHLGFDPDVEAERLSALSRVSAAGELAKSIVSTPGSLLEYSTAIILSEHLVSLLPSHLPIGLRLSNRRTRGHSVRQSMKLSDYQKKLNDEIEAQHQVR